MNKATITRGIRAYRDLLAEIAERQARADKIREWLAVHADQFDDDVDGQRVTVKAVTRVSVDSRALREASLNNPAILDGLLATYSVPAKYEPTEGQKQFITTRPAPAAIKFYEVKS
jgi:hypothetical protein|nr:MAG TPA: hypothetical protein [Caudoviricetes sp.]